MDREERGGKSQWNVEKPCAKQRVTCSVQSEASEETREKKSGRNGKEKIQGEKKTITAVLEKRKPTI